MSLLDFSETPPRAGLVELAAAEASLHIPDVEPEEKAVRNWLVQIWLSIPTDGQFAVGFST
jgi:hypothetical protein